MVRIVLVVLLCASSLLAQESPAPPQPLWLESETAPPVKVAGEPSGAKFFLEPGVQFDLTIGFPTELRASIKLGERALWLEGGVGGFVVPFFGSALIAPYTFVGVRTDLTLAGESYHRLLIRPGVGLGVGALGDNSGGFGMARFDVDFVWDVRGRRGAGAFVGAKLGIAVLAAHTVLPAPIVGVFGGLHF